MAGSNGGIHAPTSLHRKWLFWACFVSLVATSFGFLIRAFTIDEWAAQYALTETQKGEIHGAGLWPFAISIILFSLVIDRIGYGKAMVFAFVCHVGSALITIFAPDHMDPYWALYIGQFVVALANGTVEAVINPVVATMFPKDKTKWLAILHAGWPAGFVIAGLMAMGMDRFAPAAYATWPWKVSLIFLPTAIYGVMMLRQHFPQQERVTAGASYRDMCREAGVLGMWIAVFLVVSELTRIFMGEYFQQWQWGVWTVRGFNAALAMALLIPFAVYVRGAPGRLIFILMLLLMIPLATTELGTDAWIKDLMKPVVEASFGVSSGWVLIYSASVMMALRFFAGPMVRRLGPLGLLAISSAAAAGGLALMSTVTDAVILGAATVYAIGQSFFWPCVLGVVSEKCPRGGALTINTIGGVGMLGAGIVGTVLLGNIQDVQKAADLKAKAPDIYQQVVADEVKFSVFGNYLPIDAEKTKALPDHVKNVVSDIGDAAKQGALMKAALLPAAALVGFVILILFYKLRGGYKPDDIAHGEVQTE
jgi:MFS family permease